MTAAKAIPPNLAARLRKALDAGKGQREIVRELRVTRHQVRLAIKERDLEQAKLAARPTLPVEDIYVGPRFRKQMHNIERLATSINRRGTLLQGVVVEPEAKVWPGFLAPRHRLIAGARRIQAWLQSDFSEQPIPVQFVAPDDIMAAEYDENEEREPFTHSEAVEIKRAMEAAGLKAAAAERQRAGRKAADDEKGRAADKIAAVTGRSTRTLEKAEMVVRAAEQDPERFGPIKEQMDRSGKVDGPARRVKNMLSADALRAEPPPLPGRGPYRTIIIDPPWPAEIDGERDTEGRGYYPYATMTLDQIADVDVASIAHADGCALWLWITNFHLARGCHSYLLTEWGFSPSTILTWCKPTMGQGQRLRGMTEHAILAVRGDVPCLAGDAPTWFRAQEIVNKKREHSRKPGEFFEIVEKVTPAARYAYLFAGASLPENWDGHGDRIGASPAPDRLDDARRIAASDTPIADYAALHREKFADLEDRAQRLMEFGERLGRPEETP